MCRKIIFNFLCNISGIFRYPRLKGCFLPARNAPKTKPNYIMKNQRNLVSSRPQSSTTCHCRASRSALILRAVIVLMPLIAGACSSMSVTRTSDATYTEGIRFYRSRPYLLVARNADKGLAAQLVYLPDKTQEYVVKQRPGIGSSDLSVTLEGGWNLTALGHKLDTKVPEMLTAITGLVKSVGGPSDSGDYVGLYRIDYDDGGMVTGLTRISFKN